jgi:hypothetical protein
MTMVGLVLAMCFVACAAVVLMGFAEVARETPQGGRTAVAPGWVPADIPPAPRRQARYVGRHRR